jgi:nucleoside-diphosphate-sugar epimerase
VAESDIECDVFNLSSGEPTSVREVAFALVEALGLETEVYFTGKSWAGDVMRLMGDSTKLRDALGWEPRVRFKDGVKALVDWYIEEYAASNLRSSRTR